MSEKQNRLIPNNQNSSVNGNMYSYGNRNVPLKTINSLLQQGSYTPSGSSSNFDDNKRETANRAQQSLNAYGFSNLGNGAYLDPNNNVVRQQSNPQLQSYQSLNVPIPRYFNQNNGYNYNGSGTPLGVPFDPAAQQRQSQQQQMVALQQQRQQQLQNMQGRGTIPQAYIDRQRAYAEQLAKNGGV